MPAEHWTSGLNFDLNCIRDVDRSVASVLDMLVASGQADRTVIILHLGPRRAGGAHGLRQKG